MQLSKRQLAYLLQQQFNAPTLTLDQYIRSLGPAAWFRMDQGVTVTGAGVSMWPDMADTDNGLVLPGVLGNKASAPHISAYEFGAGSFTCAAWVEVAALGVWSVVVGAGKSTGADFRCFISTTNSLRLGWGTDAQLYTQSTGTISANTLTHLVWGYNASSGKVFYAIDGVYEEIVEANHALSGSDSLIIGGDVTSYEFKGSIYACRVYGSALSSTQIAADYALGVSSATSGAVFDADFSAQAKGTTSFTESSSNAATVTINQSGALPAHIGNKKDLLQGTDAARPIYLPYSGTKYLYLPGVVGNYASTPDSAANSITGDIDIRVRVSLDDWTPATQSQLCAKYETGNWSYAFSVLATGALNFQWSTNGTTQTTINSIVGTGFSDGAIKWVRCTYVTDSGAGSYLIRFLTSDDGVSWVQLGSDMTGAATAATFNGTAAVSVGAFLDGSSGALAGKIYRAIIKNGIDGTTVVDFNPADASDGATSFASSATGETWTINRSGSLPAYIVGMAGAMGNGSSHYLRASFTSDQPITDYLVCRPLSWTAGDQLIGGVSANAGAIEQSGSTPAVVLYDGSAVASNTNLALNARAVVCAVHNGANGVLRVNNTTETTGNSGSGNPGGITLFANNTPSGFANAIGYELVRFHAAHDLATRARIVAGLMARHGVA